MYEADGFQAASPYLGDRDKTWKSLDLCQRTRPKKEEGGKEEEEEDCQAERCLYLHTSLSFPLPCSLLTFKCQIRNNIVAIARRSSILCHIYDIMPYIFAYMGRKPLSPSPPPLNCHSLKWAVTFAVCLCQLRLQPKRKKQQAGRGEGEDASSLFSRVKPFKMCCYDRAAAISSRLKQRSCCSCSNSTVSPLHSPLYPFPSTIYSL